MTVHDVGCCQDERLRLDLVFAVDPQFRAPEEQLYLRYEDTGVAIKDGVENFTAFMPLEQDEIPRLRRSSKSLRKSCRMNSVPLLTGDEAV